MRTESVRGSAHYFRLNGTYEKGRIVNRHEYSDAELRKLLESCKEKPTYVFFNNISMWHDACRFQELVNKEMGKQKIEF